MKVERNSELCVLKTMDSEACIEIDRTSAITIAIVTDSITTTSFELSSVLDLEDRINV